MPNEARWQEKEPGVLALAGDWRLPFLARQLQQDAKSLYEGDWRMLSLADLQALDSATVAFVLDWQDQRRRAAKAHAICSPLPQKFLDLLGLYGVSQQWLEILEE